jgi:hypothetical protein
MILLLGVVLAVFVGWQVRHLGLYVALCDTLGLILGGVAAMSYSGLVVGLVPWKHELIATSCMAGVFLVGWMMFRTVARSFAGDLGIEFGKHLDMIGGAAVAFVGTMMFVCMASLIALTAGKLLPQSEMLDPHLRLSADIAAQVCSSITWVTGGLDTITLDRILEYARSPGA